MIGGRGKGSRDFEPPAENGRHARSRRRDGHATKLTLVRQKFARHDSCMYGCKVPSSAQPLTFANTASCVVTHPGGCRCFRAAFAALRTVHHSRLESLFRCSVYSSVSRRRFEKTLAFNTWARYQQVNTFLLPKLQAIIFAGSQIFSLFFKMSMHLLFFFFYEERQ